MDYPTLEICPTCGKKHDLSAHLKKATLEIKGVPVQYDSFYYICPNAEKDDREFCSAKMMSDNMQRARNAYRKEMGMLTSDDILRIRKKYDLSQVEMARLIGVGDVTITRYETKAIQEPIYDNILKKIDISPLDALEMLNKHKDKFSEERFIEIVNKIKENHIKYGAENLARESFLAQYKIKNLKTPDVDLIEKIISYFALRRKDLYKTILMKFLWYADKIHYELYGMVLTGLVYIHEKYGALPIGHYELLGLNNIKKEEEAYNENIIYHIYPSENVNISSLPEKVVDILDKVIDKFKDMKTNDIVKYMHNEKEYINTSQNEIMNFYR